MLILLIVSFLIGVAIAAGLSLLFRSRSASRSSEAGREVEAELISDDLADPPPALAAIPEPEAEEEEKTEKRPRGRRRTLTRRPGRGLPKPYKPRGARETEPFELRGEPSKEPPKKHARKIAGQLDFLGFGEAQSEPPEGPDEGSSAHFLHEPCGPLGKNPLEDNGFSEPQLLDTGIGPIEGERDETDTWPDDERWSGEPEAPSVGDRQAELRALLNRPKELVAEYDLPDPPLLDAWRPLGTSESDGRGGEDTTSPAVLLPASFADAVKRTAQGLDEEEQRGGFIPPETYYHLALLCFYASDFESAVAYLRMALEDNPRPVRTLNLLGLTYHMQGYETEAEGRFREAASMEHVSPQDRAIVLTNLGLTSTYRRAPDDALGYYGQALEIQRELGDRRSQAETLSRMGRLCRAKRSLYEASKYHHEALEIWRQLQDRGKMALELRLLAAVFREKGDHSEALDLSERALTVNRELNDQREEAINLGNIGLIYSLEKDLTRALEYFQSALALHHEVGNHKGEASTLGNIGNILFLQGRTQAALESYQRALELNRRAGYRWGEAVDLGNIGRILAHENDLGGAETHLREAHRLFRELNADRQAEAVETSLQQIGARSRPAS